MTIFNQHGAFRDAVHKDDWRLIKIVPLREDSF
jgi:hypothetical protein